MMIHKPVGARLLKEKIDSLYPSELLLWLTGDRGVKALLESLSPDDEARRLMITAVRKACTTGRSENMSYLLVCLRESTLFKSLSEYINSVDIIRLRTHFEQFTEDLVELLVVYMTCLPTDSASIVSLLVFLIESKMVPELNLQRLKPQLATIKEMVEDTRRKQTEDQKVPSVDEHEDGEPPDNFREISIFPTVGDLNNFKPFLRRNVVNSNFKNLETYLDIQFRLLREDFIRPLREGIKEFKDNVEKGQKGYSRDVKIYHDVRVLFPELTPQVR